MYCTHYTIIGNLWGSHDDAQAEPALHGPGRAAEKFGQIAGPFPIPAFQFQEPSRLRPRLTPTHGAAGPGRGLLQLGRHGASFALSWCPRISSKQACKYYSSHSNPRSPRVCIYELVALVEYCNASQVFSFSCRILGGVQTGMYWTSLRRGPHPWVPGTRGVSVRSGLHFVMVTRRRTVPCLGRTAGGT